MTRSIQLASCVLHYHVHYHQSITQHALACTNRTANSPDAQKTPCFNCRTDEIIVAVDDLHNFTLCMELIMRERIGELCLDLDQG
jgi:hypothetical protein